MRVISPVQSERIAYQIMEQAIVLLDKAADHRPPWGLYSRRWLMNLSKRRLEASGLDPQ